MAAQAVDVTLSGHVNRALINRDGDGRGPGWNVRSFSRTREANNGSSGSRIRVEGSGEMMDGQSAGMKLEYGAGGAGGDSLSLRYAEVYFSGGYGKFTIGHGDNGGEGSVYSDKSGVLGIGHGQHDETAGCYRELRLDLDGRVYPNCRYDYYISLDGGDPRAQRIRYDTPSFGALSAAVSVGKASDPRLLDPYEIVSAGITLSQDFGGTEFEAKLGAFETPEEQVGDSWVSGSAGVKFASGVTISGAWGEGEHGPHRRMDSMKPGDVSFYQTTLGYVFGDTSVGGSWYKSSDAVNKGSELTALGFGINHNLPGIDTNVYAAMQNYKVEDGTAYETDISVAMIGARVKF